MKNLVLSSLLLAAVASQTTGCIITSGEEATLTAEWSFHTVNPQGMLSPENLCPLGFTEVELHTQELDALDRPIGPPVIDVFDCDAHIGDAPLDPTVYEAFLSVTSPDGGTVYADSLAAIVDLTKSDKTFKAEIVDNGGYFKIGWDLRDDQTNAPISCGDLIAGKDRVGLTATLVSSTQFVADDFDCELGEEFSTFTSAVAAGTYTVTIQPVDSAGAALNQGVTLTNKVMRNRNSVTDLGVVTLQFP